MPRKQLQSEARIKGKFTPSLCVHNSKFFSSQWWWWIVTSGYPRAIWGQRLWSPISPTFCFMQVEIQVSMNVSYWRSLDALWAWAVLKMDAHKSIVAFELTGKALAGKIHWCVLQSLNTLQMCMGMLFCLIFRLRAKVHDLAWSATRLSCQTACGRLNAWMFFHHCSALLVCYSNMRWEFSCTLHEPLIRGIQIILERFEKVILWKIIYLHCRFS